jgi:hypothetical protein
MKNFNLISLGNRVLVDERVIGTTELEEVIVREIKKDGLVVYHKGLNKEFPCNLSQIEPIKLDLMILTSLGFTERSIMNSSGKFIKDRVKSTEPTGEGEPWYLLSIEEREKGLFLTVYENGVEVIGSGYPRTLHGLQNMVKSITNEKLEI